jgi:hypothetical protein
LTLTLTVVTDFSESSGTSTVKLNQVGPDDNPSRRVTELGVASPSLAEAVITVPPGKLFRNTSPIIAVNEPAEPFIMLVGAIAKLPAA